MKQVLSPMIASISELKRNPGALIEQADGEPVAILNHNRPAAYLVPADTWESLMETLEDLELERQVRERMHERDQAIPVDPESL